MLNPEIIKSLLLNNFAHEPTSGQSLLLELFTTFISSTDSNNLLVIKGYAGTGKTTSIGALVNTLPTLNLKAMLLAPTGRAAKVLSVYSKQPAFTLHKKIYKKKVGYAGEVRFELMDNVHSNVVFIVDEASMISNSGGLSSGFFGNGSLLDDLLSFVFQGNNCKLILVGDGAQLPPVGESLSPALNDAHLKKNFHLHVFSLELTDVVRQKEESGILYNATQLRHLLKAEIIEQPKFTIKGFRDIFQISGSELEDALNDAYSNYGSEEAIVICRSNKRANLFNQQIRNRILWKEEELSAGDQMMVVRNNYFWLPDKSAAGFIANGDTLEILRIKRTEELYGFNFADATVRLLDYPDIAPFDVKLLLNTISSESPALSQEENKKLYQEVSNDYMHIHDRTKKLKEVKENPYFNALQVKFAYAITCHKAQGGQWSAVFVDQGYLTQDMINIEYVRWLYTAVSRAKEKLYLVNFNKEFF